MVCQVALLIAAARQAVDAGTLESLSVCVFGCVCSNFNWLLRQSVLDMRHHEYTSVDYAVRAGCLPVLRALVAAGATVSGVMQLCVCVCMYAHGACVV